jgi:hypothetical protein
VGESTSVEMMAFVRELGATGKASHGGFGFYDPSLVPAGSAKPRTKSAPLILRLPSS